MAVGVVVDVGGGRVTVGCAGVDVTIGAGSVVSVAVGDCEEQAELKKMIVIITSQRQVGRIFLVFISVLGRSEVQTDDHLIVAICIDLDFIICLRRPAV